MGDSDQTYTLSTIVDELTSIKSLHFTEALDRLKHVINNLTLIIKSDLKSNNNLANLVDNEMKTLYSDVGKAKDAVSKQKLVKNKITYLQELIVRINNDENHNYVSETLINVLKRFPTAVRSFNDKRRKDKKERPNIVISDEYEFQDYLRLCLTVLYPLIDEQLIPKENIDSSSGKVEFHIKSLKTIIECKYIDKTRNKNEMNKSLAEKIQKYKNLSDMKTMIFLIWDHDGSINDPQDYEDNNSKLHTIDGKSFFLKYLVIKR